MIATNMAGRGTDIKLGAISKENAARPRGSGGGMAPRTVTVDSTEEQLRENVYRKIARPGAGQKGEVEMPFAELE
jgi:preprotein translocase subunit SecA